MQQENFTDVFRLTDIASERIDNAQRQLLAIALSGLALIAMIKIGISWLIHRDVITPVARLQHSAQQVAAGNWSFEFGQGGDDEIGQLSNNLGAMTRSLRASFAQVERSNQDLAALNEELEAFSYSASHDLRAPLRRIDSFSLGLIEDYGDKLDDEGKDALDRIRAASRRMSELIDDLLRLSQVTRVEINVTRVDLSAIAREIADVLEQEQPGRDVEWAIEPGLRLRADPSLMRIAMQNLLQNAWKFTGKTLRPVIRVGSVQRDAKTVYFVADNGVGFDMARADRLFSAFERMHLPDDFPGTGIGLAIVKRIVRRHNGDIRVEATVGKGAAFYFTVNESGNGSDVAMDPSTAQAEPA